VIGGIGIAPNQRATLRKHVEQEVRFGLRLQKLQVGLQALLFEHVRRRALGFELRGEPLLALSQPFEQRNGEPDRCAKESRSDPTSLDPACAELGCDRDVAPKGTADERDCKSHEAAARAIGHHRCNS
jgi:hypothetical protein